MIYSCGADEFRFEQEADTAVIAAQADCARRGEEPIFAFFGERGKRSSALAQELRGLPDFRNIPRNLPIGTELYRQGESCSSAFLIESGWIALSTLLDDGACQIIDFLTPGSFIGASFAPEAVKGHTAYCLTPVRTIAYPGARLMAAAERSSRLAALLWRESMVHEWRAQDHLVNIGLRSARERIAHLLVELYTRLHGEPPRRAGEFVHLPLTQTQLGQAIGLTGVHVSRTLRILREQRIVRFIKRDMQILDPDELASAAGYERMA